MNTFSSNVPPGFRFHPRDEEIVDYYLRRKITYSTSKIDMDHVIKDVDLYKIEPWDLQEVCKIGIEDENEWYFFSYKDKKYPSGNRTNRATAAGFWKATGRDKAIFSKQYELIGMRKTLVFYTGRAPNGQKSDWIMHEYRLQTHPNLGTPQEEGWVVCRVFKKRIATTQISSSEHDEDHVESPKQHSYNNHMYPYKEISLAYELPPGQESPKMVQPAEQVTGWRAMDKFVASQLSQDVVSNENENFMASTDVNGDLNKAE